MKTLVITGGSSGIGAAIAERFESSGYQVFNLDLSPGKAGQFIQCDVTDHQKVNDAINSITEYSRINVLICNAGIHLSANIEDTTEEELLRVFNINVKGAFSATQATLSKMRNYGGCILFIASDQALIAKNNSFAYNLSKHALASMAKTTALDYAKYNIRANAICPGTIDTPLYQNAIQKYCDKSLQSKEQVHLQEAQAQPLGRIGQPEEVAALALFLASDEAQFITGSLQVIDGGYTTA